MWPIIQRELREQARQRSTVGLRLLGAVLALWMVYLQLGIRDPMPGQEGRRMFGVLNVVLLTGLWLVGPMVSADCLSREKREGTFNLLFLTPLKPRDIVLGKAFVHGLRLAMFLLGAFPVFVVPILAGGVSGLDIVRMGLAEGAVLVLSLSAGLLASSLSRGWIQSRINALLISVASAAAVLAVYVTGQSILWFVQFGTGSRAELSVGVIWRYHWSVWMDRFSAEDLLIRLRWNPGFGGGTQMTQVWLMAGVFFISLLLVAGMVALASRHVRRVWRSPPLPPLIQNVVKSLIRERFAPGWLRRRKGRVMDRNPVQWLLNARWEQRSAWAAWLAGWILLLTFIGFRSVEISLMLLPSPLLLGVALAGVSSFRSERGEGGFELLLTTPLRPRKLVLARFLQILLQLVPLFLVWGMVLQYADDFPNKSNGWLWIYGELLLILHFVAAVASIALALSFTRLPILASWGIAGIFPILLYYLLYYSSFFASIALMGGGGYHENRYIFYIGTRLIALCLLGIVCWRALSFAEFALARRWFLLKPNRNSKGNH